MYDELAEIDWNGQENNTKRLAGLKVTYTGSEYGYKRHINSTTEFLSKVALYADTIILEDQIFHQLTRSPENVPMVMQEFYIIADFAIEYIALEELLIKRWSSNMYSWTTEQLEY